MDRTPGVSRIGSDYSALSEKLDAILARLDAPPPPEVRFFTVRQTAAYTNLSEGSVRRLLGSGKLTKCAPVRGRILIDKREVDAVVLAATTRARVGRGIRSRSA